MDDIRVQSSEQQPKASSAPVESGITKSRRRSSILIHVAENTDEEGDQRVPLTNTKRHGPSANIRLQKPRQSRKRSSIIDVCTRVRREYESREAEP